MKARQPMEHTAAREKLLQALSRSDDSSRTARADRIEWLSPLDSRPSAYSGPMDTVRLLEEARLCYINALFVATVMLATSFLEHTLADELGERGLIKGKPTLEMLIKLARGCLGLPDDLLDRADRLRKLRNPFTHRRPSDDEDTFGNRFLSAKVHPDSLLEADARLAIMVTYELFQRTLRTA